jgi:hypothetical protein
VKGIIAVLVILAAFVLVGIYVWRGQVPDATVVAILSTPVGAVIGFYFGHVNGAATALANQTTALAAQALSAATMRRGTDPPMVQPAVLVMPPPLVQPPSNPTPNPPGVAGG